MFFKIPHAFTKKNHKLSLILVLYQRGTQESLLLKEIAKHKYENKPYIAPDMKEVEAASRMIHSGATRNPGYYIPAFQSSRLTAAFNHLLPNKEANKYQRKF